MKSKFTLWSVVLLLAGFIFVGCDNERTENASDFQTGIHKIVIQQSGDTDSFEVSVNIGGPQIINKKKLYNDKGEYIGDSYSAQIRTAAMSCRTNGHAFFMTCGGSVSSSSEAGIRLHISVFRYIDD